MATVGFIGVGVMGREMVLNLLKGGHRVRVFDARPEAAESLRSDGAEIASSVADAVQAAEVAITMLPDTPHVQQVVLGPEGILANPPAGRVLIEMSTISPQATREMSAALAKAGVAMLDAPVSGGPQGAKNATLSIMVGGEAAVFDRVKPLFAHMGKTITHCGPSGAGQLTKLVNQVLVSVNNLAVSEALTFARANGLDEQKTITAVGGGAAGSWQLTNLGPRMVAGDFAPGFMIKLQVKDLRLAMEAAKEAGLNLSALQTVSKLFQLGMEEGKGNEGTQALFSIVQEQSKAK
jgi:2-hydroxy-3-oxopropionate reductase